MKTLRTLCMASALGAGLASSAGAENYRWSTWLPESETTTNTLVWFMDQLREQSNGAIDFEVFSSAALMPPKAHLKGIGDGVVQGGFHTPAYTPSEAPITVALGGFGFIETDPVIIGMAWADFLMNDPEQNGEYVNQNVVPVGSVSTMNYPIICNTSEPITEAEQLKGLKIRTLGLLGKLFSDLGAVPVNIPGTEVYQALETGQIDCAAILAGFLNIDGHLDEVSQSTTMMNLSPSFSSPMQLYNKDFWKSLTTEQRALMLKLAAQQEAMVLVNYHDAETQALDAATAKGHKVVQPGDSMKKAVAEWVASGVGDMAGVAKNTYGIQDPDALFARFRPYVEKWQGLIGGMTDKYDQEELTKVISENLFDKLDPATYGMN